MFDGGGGGARVDDDSKATLRSSVCTIPGQVPGPRPRMPQHHHDG